MNIYIFLLRLELGVPRRLKGDCGGVRYIYIYVLYIYIYVCMYVYIYRYLYSSISLSLRSFSALDLASHSA